jgi:hypothetical protein
MFGLLDIVKMAGAATLAGLIAYNVGHWHGDDAGYDRRIAEVAAASKAAELERKNDNAKLREMSVFDLCVADLNSRKLPISPCEQLRGL